MEYKPGFHQHQYKPFITGQPWNTSNNSNVYNNIVNSRDYVVWQAFDIEAQHNEIPTREGDNDLVVEARIKEEGRCVNDSSIIFSLSSSSSSSIINEGEPVQYSQPPQYYGDARDYNNYDQKPTLVTDDGGIRRGRALSKRSYYNFNDNSQMLYMGDPSRSSRSDTTCSFLQRFSYDSFVLNYEHQHTNNMQMQRKQNSPSNSSNQISAFLSGAARTKPPPKYSTQSKELSDTKPNKKSRPSCSPLKVRKEKLGDRIQTLQKLVAPFGKTNTASVLTEAIGYIHFLHDQIQTLSVPYMESSQTRPLRMMQLMQDSTEEDSRESKWRPDLRSRGLCLVPLSYALYIHNFD